MYFRVLTSCILLSLSHVFAYQYDIPLHQFYNEFTDYLFQRLRTDISNHLGGTFVIYDVLRAQSELTSDVQYKIALIVAEADCGVQITHNYISLATCGIKGSEFYQCKAEVTYRPWIEGTDRIVVPAIDCQTVAPSLPKNPYFLGFTLPANVKEQFTSFQRTHNRVYSEEEATKRFIIFKKNLLKARLLQALDKGSAEYGTTVFSDLDEHEFKQTRANLKWPHRSTSSKVVVSAEDVDNAPTSFDWRVKGAVTNVKDQGWCGSCWAFGTTGNIETQWFRKSGNLIPLSEQQLLDCDSHDEACNGGLPEWAFDAIIKMGGLMSEEAYPYEAHKENACHLVKRNVSAKIDSWAQLPTDERRLAAWLAQNGTITTGINANFLQFYIRGISHPPHFLCSEKGLDHAVLLAGYGVSSILRRPYWIVKNSWGASWGESGYFRLYRGDGTCGINADATTSIIY